MSTEDRYALELPLGESTYGTVWAAQDSKLRRKVVVTALNEDATPLVRERFEALIDGGIASLRAPTIARVIDAGHGADGLPFLVTEFQSDAPSLATRFDSGPAIKIAAAVRLIVDLLGAVSKLGITGLTHGDISPGNVLVVERHSRLSPRLIGFGLNRATVREGHDELMSSGHLESLGYLAPEQAGEDPTSSASGDVFSTVGLLFTWVTGRTPFRGDTAEQVRSAAGRLHVPRVGALRPELEGTELAAVLDRALERDPHDRFKDAATLITKLRAAVLMAGAARELDVLVGERSMAPDDSDEALSAERARPVKPSASTPKVGRPDRSASSVPNPPASKALSKPQARPRRRARKSTVIGFAPVVAPTPTPAPETSDSSTPAAPVEEEEFESLSGLLMISDENPPSRIQPGSSGASRPPTPPPTARLVPPPAPRRPQPPTEEPDEDLDAMLDDLDGELGGPDSPEPSADAATDEQNDGESSAPSDASLDVGATRPSDAVSAAGDEPSEPAEPVRSKSGEAEGLSTTDAADEPPLEAPLDEPQDEAPQADEPQADEPQDDAPQDDAPQDEEPEANDLQADESEADESEANDLQADESEADESEADESEANDLQADEPREGLAAASETEPTAAPLVAESPPPATADALGQADDDDYILPGSSPPWAWIGVGVTAAAIAAVGILWFSSSNSDGGTTEGSGEISEIASDPAPEEPEAVAPTEQLDPEPVEELEPTEEPLEELTMTLSGIPEGASVTVDGEPLEGVEFTIAEEPREVAVNAEGFDPWSSTVDRDSPSSIEVELIAAEPEAEDSEDPEEAADAEASDPPVLTRAQRRRRALLRRRRRERRRARAQARERPSSGVGPNPY